MTTASFLTAPNSALSACAALSIRIENAKRSAGSYVFLGLRPRAELLGIEQFDDGQCQQRVSQFPGCLGLGTQGSAVLVRRPNRPWDRLRPAYSLKGWCLGAAYAYVDQAALLALVASR
jgi:hypothetical protein